MTVAEVDAFLAEANGEPTADEAAAAASEFADKLRGGE